MSDPHKVFYSIYTDFPIGRIYVASTERGICACHSSMGDTEEFLTWLVRYLPEAAICHDQEYNQEIARQLREYFAGDRREFDLTYDMRGTDFQIRVWRELQKIPYGQTISYGELARRVGGANYSRAVGGANNKNPIGIIVPCHRVIGSTGKLVGYAGGLQLKRKLLQLESGALFPME